MDSEKIGRMGSVMNPVKFFYLLFAALPALGSPVAIHDAKILAGFENGVGKFTEDDSLPSADDLVAALKEAPEVLEEPFESTGKRSEDPLNAVYILGGVYKCGKCDRWHPGGLATAWALSPDGLMVTNYHVFEKAKGGAMGVCNHEGKTYPVTEILAADKGADIAVFRVRAKKLDCLSLGATAEVGSRVHVVSHPNRRFYMQTFGDVARYYIRPPRRQQPKSTWMTITADYAKGSSGGPVMNTDGQVVGMVSSTQSIYYESDNGQPKGALQMVVKNCVPAASIAAVLGQAEE